MNINLINTEETVVIFHGTTKSAFENILKHGFNSCSDIWNCSNPCDTYFYDYEKFCEVEGIDIDDECSYEQAISRANEQGQIQNALKENPDNETVVIEIHIPKKWACEYLEPDTSCRNMEGYGAVQILTEDLNELIRNKEVVAYVHRFEFAIKCSLMYIVGLINNEYIQPGIEKLPPYEYTALLALSKGGFNEDFYEQCITYPDKIEAYKWL